MTTNYERIKSMSIEELANYMTNFVLNSIALNVNQQNFQITCDVMNTYKTNLEWLQQKELQNIIHEMEEDTIITDRYKQALDKIEEIIKHDCNECKENYYNQHCEDCNTQTILTIINEVLNANI